MSETNTPQLSDKEMEEIVERAVAPSAAPASSDIHPDDAQPLLKITDLEVTFTSSTGVVPAVRGANLTIYPGQTVAIVGESGSGKSTTAAAVIGLLPGTGKVAGGTIEFDGQDITNLSTNEWVALRGSGIGLVPQDPMSNLNPVLRVGYQVKEALLANNVVPRSEAGQRVTALLEEAGLPDAERRAKQYPHEFSGGMRQRALIAIGMAAHPKLLIADEPTSALDVTVQRRILDHLGKLTSEMGTAVLFITHDLGLAAERAEQLGVELYDNVDDIVPLADFITVHLPKTKETIGMFGPAQYAAMKDGVILVNTARGGIYNIESLADFVAAGKIGGAAIDVYETEPCTESPLHEFDNVILTPHLGASTKEAQTRAGTQIAEYVAAGLEGSIVPTAVNMALVPPEIMDAVGPYVPACQLMGSMLAQIDGDIPQYLKLTAAGSLAGADPSILVAGTMGGILSYKNVAVTPVNAEAVAKRHGIKVETQSRPDAQGYASAVSIVADGTEISCTLADTAQVPRIVSLFGYQIDIAPASQSLIFEYVDAPGKIGTIGTILGSAGINITTMQVGMKEKEKNALVYMNVEGAVDDSTMDRLRAGLGELKNLWYVKL